MDIRQEIVEILRREYAAGMINLFEGNISARVGDRVYSTPSQVSKLKTSADMMIETDLSGNILHLPEGLRPTSELSMHLEIYRLLPAVTAVVHNHSTFASAFAMNHTPIASDALTEINLTLGEVPLAAYGAPGTADIHKDFERLIGPDAKKPCHAILLANHGLVAFGENLEMAFSYAEAAEKAAKTIFISKLMGGAVPLPKEELALLRSKL